MSSIHIVYTSCNIQSISDVLMDLDDFVNNHKFQNKTKPKIEK